MSNKQKDLTMGDKVTIGGFAPMSTMEEYEGKTGTVAGIHWNQYRGADVSINLGIDKGGFCKIPIKFVHLIND